MFFDIVVINCDVDGLVLFLIFKVLEISYKFDFLILFELVWVYGLEFMLELYYGINK